MPFNSADLQAWLRETVLPFWAKSGFDSQNRAFLEKLDLDAQPSDEDYTRVRVQARQIYVYAHAFVGGLYPDGLKLAQSAYTFLSGRAWDSDGAGWYHILRRDGTPLDRTKDCYDHAFVLLALAWLYRAGGDAAVLDRARRTVAFLDRELGLQRDGAFDGYAERAFEAGEALPQPRRQNPHMHLLEALLALYEATGESEWLDRAASVLRLFSDRFFCEPTGQLIEFFDLDWREVAAEGAFVREPGHHFEWVWLLHRYGQLSGQDWVLSPMRKLFDWGWENGIDRRDDGVFGAYDTVDSAGRILMAGSKRLWPQTEALKACLAVKERCGDPAAEARAASLLQSMFRHFVSRDHALWRDQLGGDGRMIATSIPASSLYHLYLAITEVMRVTPDGLRA